MRESVDIMHMLYAVKLAELLFFLQRYRAPKFETDGKYRSSTSKVLDLTDNRK